MTPWRYDLTVHGIHEPTPGPRWRALFDATWPAYRAWYLAGGDAARPTRTAAVGMLGRHMPELVPTFERLVGLAGGDPVAERMLTLWNAPAFLPACSYTAAYRPAAGVVDYCWPGLRWRRGFDDPDATRTVVLDETVTAGVVDESGAGRDS